MIDMNLRNDSVSSTRMLISLGVASLLGLAVGCSNSSQPLSSEAELSAQESQALDHTHPEFVILDGDKAVEEAFVDGPAKFVQEKPFRQVGFFYRADGVAANPAAPLTWRARYTDGKWSDWAPVEVTWQEEELFVARAILAQEALEIELRGAQGLRAASIEFYEEVVANTGTLARDLPFEKAHEHSAPVDLSGGVEPVSEDGYRTVGQRVAPRSLVIPRSEWGARSTNCKAPHTPYRMAIHHTYSPSSDGGDAARAMRGMQAYHIDSNGWCDIGYHFVVSQSANIYQGRASETDRGAHVGGQNTGNIGTCLIGDFTSTAPSESQLAAAGRIVGWIHETYSIPLNRTSVLGHREHAGQSTSCPGTALLNKIPHILDLAGNGGAQANYDMPVQVKWIDTENFYTQGSSHNVADALPGERFQAEILIKNASDGVVRDVWGGFQIMGPYLKASDYQIYSDHPAYDQSSWTLNDANDEPENPPSDNLGAAGKLNLNAFSPGETKRILIDIEATQYSMGASASAVVRGWVRQADSTSGRIYGVQEDWDDSAGTNDLSELPRGYARADVLERDTWLFDDVSDAANLEGWTGAPEEAIASLKVNTSLGAMALKHADANVALSAPGWTEVNADQYDQLVLRMRSHDGAHTAAVRWGSGDGLDDTRMLAFRGPGDGEFNDLVIPMGSHAGWAGTVKELQIVPLVGAAPGEEASGWYDLDAIFFQSSAEQATSAPGEAYNEAPPVELIDPNQNNKKPVGPGTDPGGDPTTPGGDGGASDGEDALVGAEHDPRVEVKSGGCSTAADSGAAPLSPMGVAWVAGLGALGLVARRRRH